jgi:putative addiction module killer protein
MDYILYMIELIQSETFRDWLIRLKDRQAKARIQARIDRLALGNPGDVKAVGDGISELRIDYGPGYRVYFTRRGPALILLLAGGDKRSQDFDIARAVALAKEWED